MLDAGTIEQALISPAIYWAYELMIFFGYFIITFFRRWGKDLHLIGDMDKRGVFTELGHKYVEPTESKFRTRSGRGFSTERGRFGYIAAGFGGGHRVIFHLLGKTRPRDIQTKEDENMMWFRVKADLPQENTGRVDRKGNAVMEDADDPTSEDFGHMVAGEVKDQVAAGSKGAASYGKMLLVLALAAGLAIGAIVMVIAYPHGLYPVANNCIPTIVNGTATCASTGVLP